MAASRKFRRNLIGQGSTALGGSVIFDVPRTVDYNAVSVLCAGVITNTVAFTAIKNDGILNLIKSLEVIVNGSDVVYSITGAQAVRGALVRTRHGSQASIIQPLVAIGASPFEFEFNIDFAAFGAMRPKDSNLRAFDYTNVQIRVNFASALTDIFTGAGAGVLTSNALTLLSDETQELFGDDGNRSQPILRRYHTNADYNFAGAGVQRIRLDPNQLIRGFSFRAIDAAGALVNTVMGNVKVIHGTDVLFDCSAGMMREVARIDFQSIPSAGWYYLDLIGNFGAPDHLADMISTYLHENGNIDAYLEITSVAAGTVNVQTHGFRKMNGGRGE